MPDGWKPLEERHVTDDFSEVFRTWWFSVDSNFDVDGNLTIRELLTAGRDLADYHNLNVDELVGRLGEDFEWYEHPDVFGSIIASKYAYG